MQLLPVLPNPPANVYVAACHGVIAACVIGVITGGATIPNGTIIEVLKLSTSFSIGGIIVNNPHVRNMASFLLGLAVTLDIIKRIVTGENG